VLVVDDKNQVESRPVQLGVLTGGMREILSGLKPTEQIIVTGLQRVRPGVTVTPKLIKMPEPLGASASSAAPPG
jgi:multidrug efflux pump subunit AcrA (membrane-fusion protein)